MQVNYKAFYVMLFGGMLIITQWTWIQFLPTHRKNDLRSAGQDGS